MSVWALPESVHWPKGWRNVPLWAMFDRVKDVGHPEEEMLSVYRAHGIVQKSSRDDNNNQTAENRNIYQRVDNGWLVVNRMKAWQGSVGISALRGIVSGHYLCFRPRHDEESRFLNWLLRSDVYTTEYARMSRGVRPGQIEIDNDELRGLRIALPPLDEQRRIADFLDAETAFVDRIHVLRSQQREQLIQRRWSVFQYALDRVSKDSLPLRRLLHSVVDGPFGSAFSSSDYIDDGAAVVRLGNIGFCEYRPEDQARIPIPLYSELRKHEVREGDILIAGLGDPRNHAGRACIAPDLGPAIVKGKCFRARVERARTSAEFLVLLLSSPLGAAILEGRGSTRSMINLEIVKSAVLPIPRYADQVAIADEMSRYWQSALAVVQACDRQLALIAERRQALITAAVTGQIDVTTARGLSSSGGVAV